MDTREPVTAAGYQARLVEQIPQNAFTICLFLLVRYFCLSYRNDVSQKRLNGSFLSELTG
jgi:hypothetical protein